MCGRRLGKNFLTLLQHWSGAVMCAACLCGVAFDSDMREALTNAARRYGLTVNLPSIATLQSNQISLKRAREAAPPQQAGDYFKLLPPFFNGIGQ
jgi:hypothetical protein